MDRFEAELALSPTATFGEGPVWDERDGALWWTDIPGNAVHRFDPANGGDETIPVRSTVGTIAPRAAGGLVAATSEGFSLLGRDGALEVIAPVNADDPELRMNDGKCDRSGRFYASTMRYAGDQPVGELFRLDADRSVHVEDTGLTIGNGLAWTADGRTLYFTDTPTGRVDRYDVDPVTGSLSNRREAFSIDASHGQPDGMCIDDEGALWVAMWRGSSVRRYSPDGELLAVVDLPVSNVTCPAFGGPGYGDLYVTTAAPQFSGKNTAEPLGGALFRLRPGVTGPPPNAYAG